MDFILTAVAKTLVAMEQSYVSAAFFRHLTKERLQRHQAEMLLAEGMHGQCFIMDVHCSGLKDCILKFIDKGILSSQFLKLMLSVMVIPCRP